MRRAQRTDAGHVLDDDGWMAGDEIAQMPRQQARVEVIAAARAIADNDLNLLAAIEIGDVVGARGPGEHAEKHDAKRGQ